MTHKMPTTVLDSLDTGLSVLDEGLSVLNVFRKQVSALEEEFALASAKSLNANFVNFYYFATGVFIKMQEHKRSFAISEAEALERLIDYAQRITRIEQEYSEADEPFTETFAAAVAGDHAVNQFVAWYIETNTWPDPIRFETRISIIVSRWINNMVVSYD